MEAELTALLTVVIIDLVLAGDNAIVVGMAAAGLAEADRRRAVILGIAAAAVLRIIFAVFASGLLSIIGLTLAGGLLLLWVVWKLGREILAEWKLREFGRADRPASVRRRRRVSAVPSSRSSSPTCRCRSTTCSRSRARRDNISSSWSSGSPSRSG